MLYRGCDTKWMCIRRKAKRAAIKPWFNLMNKAPFSVSIVLPKIPYQSCFVTSQYPSTPGVHTQIHTFATPTQRVIATYHVIPKSQMLHWQSKGVVSGSSESFPLLREEEDSVPD